MNNYTFYQLLDRELPRSIEGASRLLGAAEVVEEEDACLGALGYSGGVKEGPRNPALHKVYPMEGNRNLSKKRCSRIQSIGEARDALGQISLAYAISNYKPFAAFAGQFIEEVIIGNELLSVDEFSGEFNVLDVSSSKASSHELMPEVILGLEMILRSGRLKDGPTKKLFSILNKRLSVLERKSTGSLALSEQLGCLLERSLIALFLRDFEAFEKVSFQYKDQYFGCLVGDESMSCLECYFALSYWVDQGLGKESNFLEIAFHDLRAHQANNLGLASISRGAWVLPEQTSRFATMLKETSLLLFLGEGRNEPDMIDCWIEGLECAFSQNQPNSNLLTRPLLWFGLEAWGYRPFSQFNRNNSSILGRL